MHCRLPLIGLFDDVLYRYKEPLFSFKWSEFSEEERGRVQRCLKDLGQDRPLRYILHDFNGIPEEVEMMSTAEALYCLNHEIFGQALYINPRSRILSHPATIVGIQRFIPTEITIFSFGMAHKIQLNYYEKLRNLLERTGKTFAFRVSTALHESVSFNDSTEVFGQFNKSFGGKLYFMGFLSDDAVYNYLIESTFFAAFFAGGVRANNSTVCAAMNFGAVVITNLDEYSPATYKHMENLIDINRCDELFLEVETLDRIRANAEQTAHSVTWSRVERELALP